MLLSRVADALYWASRYLERAEHTARLIDVAVDISLGQQVVAGDGVGGICGRLILPPGVPVTSQTLHAIALLDVDNRNSVAACVIAARDNARQVRDEITTEMWEQINALFLRVIQMRSETTAAGQSNYLARSIIQGVHLIEGITDATMNHGEGWQYLQAGRFMERAGATAALLDACFVAGWGPDAMRPLDQAEWVAVLRACAAVEGYCRQYTAEIRPDRVAEFLLLNADFPRSIRFSARRIEESLVALAKYSGRTSGARAQQLSGRLRASLDYSQIDEVLAEGPHPYLTNVGRQCSHIHLSLYQSYISYSIDSALPA